MVRMLVLYPTPTDAEAFERHYFDVHVPLAKALPGVRRYTVGRNIALLRGEEPFYLVGEVDWDDMASLQRDFQSDAGRATAQDVEQLSQWCPGVRSMIFEVEEV